jgi:hypothetical protein
MTDRLYQLLPAIYRLRDANQGEALRALLGVIEGEFQALEDDIGGLYEDWFIETAAEWVVPYIGDLLGVRGLHSSSSSEFSLRAYVANTLAYRRRKGTATMLEQLAHDITGWNARVVEFFELLGTTQYLNHLRPFNVRTPDFRNADALELLDTPFDSAAHTADIRHISNAGLRPAPTGRHNIPNIGIYLWRLEAFTVEQGDARPQAAGPEFFTFSPLGFDGPLFNPPRTEQGEGTSATISHLADEINVPTPLRRRPLYAELEDLRQSLADGSDFSPQYFDPDRPVLQVFVDNSPDPIPSERLLICDLSDWRNPPTTKDYVTTSSGTPVTVTLPIEAAVDPVLGRLAFPSGAAHDPVRVSFAYGFSGDVGGGPYRRKVEIPEVTGSSTFWQVGVSHRTAPVTGEVYATLADAVTDWNSQPAGTIGVIAIMDSCTYVENLTGPNAIQIPKGSQLLIVAADWPAVEDPLNPGVFIRTPGELTPDEVRPHLQGNLSVRGLAPANDPNPGTFRLDGLLVEGRLTVLAGNLGGLQVDHSTLLPATDSLTVNAGGTPATKNAQMNIQLTRTICGRVTLPDSVPAFSATESILDLPGVPGGLEINAPGADVSLTECTVFGGTQARSLEASDTIFNGTVTIERRQTGCVRYSFVPDHSSTPRRYRCQPDLSLAKRAEALGLSSVNDLSSAERTRIIRRVKPEFNSNHYGDPDYAQLRLTRLPGMQQASGDPEFADPSILNGAEDGSEMGVFSYLKQPQREANLRASLDEYLRLGLEAGIFFVT